MNFRFALIIDYHKYMHKILQTVKQQECRMYVEESDNVLRKVLYKYEFFEIVMAIKKFSIRNTRYSDQPIRDAKVSNSAKR